MGNPREPIDKKSPCPSGHSLHFHEIKKVIVAIGDKMSPYLERYSLHFHTIILLALLVGFLGLHTSKGILFISTPEEALYSAAVTNVSIPRKVFSSFPPTGTRRRVLESSGQSPYLERYSLHFHIDKGIFTGVCPSSVSIPRKVFSSFPLL
jgi:hypothetical protein